MKTIDPNLTFNDEELMQIAIRRKTTANRFRLPLSTQQAAEMLRAFYRAEVAHRHAEFIDDPFTRDNIAAAARLLTGQSPKFGILICGSCGNGKTTLIYALQALVNYLDDLDLFPARKTGIAIFHAKDIAYMARNRYDDFLRLRQQPILAIDDLGEEPHEVLDYGNVQNPILELIEYRYNAQLSTFVTTNLDTREIKAKYGARIADRCREMFHIIVFENQQSYRR